MFSKVISSKVQSCLFSYNLKRLFIRNEDILSCFTRQNTQGFFQYVGSLVHGFLRSARHFESGESPGDEIDSLPSEIKHKIEPSKEQSECSYLSFVM